MGRLPSCLRVIVTALVTLAACDDLLYTVDDADPRIQYNGPWIKNPIDDPKHVNSMGTLSLTNVSQTTATFVFHGGECRASAHYAPAARQYHS